jgi:asparagine synthetase B (glutamine-hydrolysing)
MCGIVAMFSAGEPISADALRQATARFHHRGPDAQRQWISDTLRGPILASLPFYDRDKVVALLDRLPTMDDGGRTAVDPALMMMLSACVLHERFTLAA